MKITPEHYEELQGAVERLLEVKYLPASAVKTSGHHLEVLWATGWYTNRSELHYLNDDNIATAMRKIIRDMREGA